MRIPLSYTPIDHSKLAEVLVKYNPDPHLAMLTDFERRLAEYAPGRFPVAVHSGTSAIHLSLKAMGVGKGDIVVVPTFTYVGSVNPVLYEGAVPVFVDCEPDTWNIDVQLLREAVTDLIRHNQKPRAIIVVHTYGMPCDMKSISEISREFEIPVLEDAAEAMGATIGGSPAGSLGEIGILSFNNNKTFTTYGGGAVLCGSENVAKKVLYWATQSREAKPYYLHVETGFNYRMSPLAAAMGLAMWPEWADRVARRVQIWRWYREQLEPLGWQGPRELYGTTSAWLSVFKFPEAANGHQISKVIEGLADNSIEIRPLWNPLHANPLFAECKVYGGKESQRLFERGICLPSSNQLPQEQLDEVIRALKIV